MGANDTQPIIAVALRSAEPAELEPDKRYALVVPAGGEVDIVNPPAEATLGRPRRRSGTTTVLDVDSLKVLFDKHSLDETEVYGDREAGTFTAVINADTVANGSGGDGAGGAAGWRDHRVVLRCAKTPSWLAWEAIDGKLLGQQDFAEFIEARALDVQEPTAAEMRELALTFEATSKVDFQSALAPSSTTRSLTYAETSVAKAGQKGEIEIPTFLGLVLQPYEASAAYRIRARFRYRILNGQLSLGVQLERPEDVLREAFKDLTDKVAEATGGPVLNGTAPDARVATPTPGR